MILCLSNCLVQSLLFSLEAYMDFTRLTPLRNMSSQQVYVFAKGDQPDIRDWENGFEEDAHSANGFSEGHLLDIMFEMCDTMGKGRVFHGVRA